MKALWTLYAGFVYIVVALILGLVIEWSNWGAVEYGAVVAGPMIIYLVRLSVDSYYAYRISTVVARLDELQKERDKTIDKLKASTRYNSTQQLLEKYGGNSPQGVSSPEGSAKKRKPGRPGDDSPQAAAGTLRRTGVPPPPTANIPRNLVSSSPPRPNLPPPAGSSRNVLPSRTPEPLPGQPLEGPQPGPPEFAPNAFAEPPQYAPSHGASGSHWYDRLLDVLLGDDETLPKNRLALICFRCKLVNGQAPPGTKDLAEVGRWRCQGCGSLNGEEETARKIVYDELKKQRHDRPDVAVPPGGRGIGKQKISRTRVQAGPARGHHEDDDYEAEDPWDTPQGSVTPDDDDKDDDMHETEEAAPIQDDEDEEEGDVRDSFPAPAETKTRPTRTRGKPSGAGGGRKRKP